MYLLAFPNNKNHSTHLKYLYVSVDQKRVHLAEKVSYLSVAFIVYSQSKMGCSIPVDVLNRNLESVKAARLGHLRWGVASKQVKKWKKEKRMKLFVFLFYFFTNLNLLHESLDQVLVDNPVRGGEEGEHVGDEKPEEVEIGFEK